MSSGASQSLSMVSQISMISLSEETSTLTLANTFLHLQEERVKAYNKFHEGFKEYLRTVDFPKYNELCLSITQEFTEISNQIIRVEKALSLQEQTELATLIRKIQNNEREKLLVTVNYQISKKEYVVDKEEEYDGVMEKKLLDDKKKLNEITNEIVDLLEEVKEIKYELQEQEGSSSS